MTNSTDIRRSEKATDHAHRYAGMTWFEVREANEFFDGEDEIEAHHFALWAQANPSSDKR